MTTIFDVANWFLSKESMDHKKLQKLCYYAQAWSLVLNNNTPIFKGDFEAWAHGPVNRKLWNEFKEYCLSDIPQDVLSDRTKTLCNRDNEMLELVWATYGDLTGFQLESITHKEDPWIEARSGVPPYAPSRKVISKETMRKYYASQYSGDSVGE